MPLTGGELHTTAYVNELERRIEALEQAVAKLPKSGGGMTEAKVEKIVDEAVDEAVEEAVSEKIEDAKSSWLKRR